MPPEAHPWAAPTANRAPGPGLLPAHQAPILPRGWLVGGRLNGKDQPNHTPTTIMEVAGRTSRVPEYPNDTTIDPGPATICRCSSTHGLTEATQSRGRLPTDDLDTD